MSRWLYGASLLLLIGCSGEGDGGRCRGELNDVGKVCPGSYDGTMEHLPACSGTTTSQAVNACRAAIVLVASGPSSSTRCYNDPATSALVGAKVSADAPFACGEKSMVAGTIDETECRETITSACP